MNRARAGGVARATAEVARYVVSLLEHPACVFLTLFPVIVVRAFVSGVPGRYDADCWWVAAAGREILRTGAVPTTNLFSFVDGGQPWLMHEWLMGPLFAWGLARLGPPFLALLALLVGTSTLSVAVATIARESKSVFTAWGSTALVLGCYSDRFVSTRPTGVALIFPVILIALALRPTFGVRSVVASTVTMLVWTNAHGSFPFGLAILAFAVLSDGDRRARGLALVLGGLATLCNPYGIRLHRFVYHYLLGDEPVTAVVHQRIAEFSPLWRAPDWITARVLLGLAMLATLIGCGLFVGRPRRRALLCVPIVLLGVVNVRHLELAGLSCVMLLVPAMDIVAEWLGAAMKPPPNWFGWLTVVGGALATIGWAARTAQHPREDTLLGDHRSAAILTASLPDGARVFAPFDTAALVTWLAYPRGVLTFADPRNDCFRAATLETFMDLETASGGAHLAETLTETGVTHVLLPDAHPEAAALAHLPGWTPQVRNGDWTLFARSVGVPQD